MTMIIITIIIIIITIMYMNMMFIRSYVYQLFLSFIHLFKSGNLAYIAIKINH